MLGSSPIVRWLHWGIGAALSVLLIQCQSATCLPESQWGAKLRWGVLDSSNRLVGYQLAADGTLDSIVREDPARQPRIIRQLGKVSQDTVCAVLQQAQRLFLQNRPLFVRVAQRSAYLEYTLPATKQRAALRLFAIWDFRFENAGNRAFRRFYQRLLRMRHAVAE